MKGFESLIVGVDGSDASAHALLWAANRLSDTGSLHVVHAFPDKKRPGLGVRKSDREALRNEAEAALNGAWTATVRELGLGHDTNTYLVADDAAEALLSVAGESDGQAVVVGAHGSTNNQHVLGHVTRKLLHHSELPVIVVKPEQPVGVQANSSVIACVGYGAASDEAARWAADYAVSAGLPLTLLHVVGHRPMFPHDSLSDTIASYFGPDVSLEWAQMDLDAMKDELLQRRPSLTIDAEVELGFTVRSIQAVSAGADLVVVGKRSATPLVRGTIAPRLQQLVVRMAAPVAVVLSYATDP